MEWAAQEGWNPGHHDAALFAGVDPEGFLGGFLDGELVSCISAVRFAPSFGFIGFYLVRPEVRGRGFGYAVWQAAMKQLDERVIGLDGVVDQQDNYRRSGFVWTARNVRYAGRTEGPYKVPLPAVSEAQVSRIVEYDAAFFPGDRRGLTQAWLRQPDALVVVSEDNGVQGYAVARPCRVGYKVAPLFADTPGIAMSLWGTVTQALPPGTEVFLDVATAHHRAVELARQWGLVEVFETARMYRGPAPEIATDRTYGVMSFELG